jgi:hypothetical protein
MIWDDNMISTWTPERVNEVFGHVSLDKISKKNYAGTEDEHTFLCTVRHPREAFLSSQRFEMCSMWKNILITRKGTVILSIFRDRLE